MFSKFKIQINMKKRIAAGFGRINYYISCSYNI